MPRYGYRINDTHTGTDAAASASAAFSACSLLYSNRTLTPDSPSYPAKLTNSSYATKLLDHSRQLFTLAVNATGGMQFYQKAAPQVADSYPSTSYGDDLVMASLFLAMVDNSTAYIKLADQWWNQYRLSEGGIILDWDSKSAAIPILFTQILAASPSLVSSTDKSKWNQEAEHVLDKIVAADGPGYLTRGGLLYFGQGGSDLTSISPVLNSVMLLVRYSPFASTPAKQKSYLVSEVFEV